MFTIYNKYAYTYKLFHCFIKLVTSWSQNQRPGGLKRLNDICKEEMEQLEEQLGELASKGVISYLRKLLVIDCNGVISYLL